MKENNSFSYQFRKWAIKPMLTALATNSTMHETKGDQTNTLLKYPPISMDKSNKTKLTGAPPVNG